MKITAAVVHERSGPFTVEQLDLDVGALGRVRRCVALDLTEDPGDEPLQ